MDAVKRHNLPSVYTNKMANKDALRKTGFEPANMLRNGMVAWPLRNSIFDVIVASSNPRSQGPLSKKNREDPGKEALILVGTTVGPSSIYE